MKPTWGLVAAMLVCSVALGGDVPALPLGSQEAFLAETNRAGKAPDDIKHRVAPPISDSEINARIAGNTKEIVRLRSQRRRTPSESRKLSALIAMNARLRKNTPPPKTTKLAPAAAARP